jgi:single-stranded-DNA-specific exonuclease
MNDIIFKIGPRINASGRMENGQLAVNLLVERNLDKALELAKEIDEFNDQRREADKQMTEEANELVHGLLNTEDSKRWASEMPLSIVVYDETWKKGILGIVATRLAEEYFRPTIVFTREGDYAVGSARSVAGFDIYAAIRSCRELLINFGGHTYACGLTIRWSDVERFKKYFEKYVAEHIDPTQTEPAIKIEAVIDFADINRRLLHDLKRFSPFGPGNMKPHFMTKEVFDFGTSKVVGRMQKHIKMELVDSKSPTVVNGIAFGQAPLVKQIKSRQAFDIAYTIEENQYKKGCVQLQIDDIHFHTEG